MRQDVKVAVGAGAAAIGALLIGRARRSSYSFRGRVVVITGGSRGLGLVLARRLAGEGARLGLLARDRDELDRAQHELREAGAEVMIELCDVRDLDQAQRSVEQVATEFGRLDVLINNAGVIQVGPVDHMELVDYEEAMATHFWGPLYTTLAAIPLMRRQGEGRIVNISSIGGKIGVPHLVPYCASKFALAGLSDSLRPELAKDGIYLTAVYPGLMRTGSPINAQFKGRHEAEFRWFAVSDSLPLATIGAERAARQIVEACRRGAPELVITMQARLAIVAHALLPSMTARVQALAARMLPGPTGREGDAVRPGWQSQSRWAPSPLTALTNRAARRNNQLPVH